MADFTLDTSGRVACTDPLKPCICHAATWDRLPPFTQGYVEALFASGGDVDYLRCNIFRRPGFSDLAPETLQRITEDCERVRAPSTPFRDARVAKRAGEAFWRERQAELCGPSYPPLTPYLGDDGLIYLREGGGRG